MMPVDSSAALALALALVLMLSLLAARKRRQPARPAAKRPAAEDSAAWKPHAARVLTVAERQAHTLLCQALPGYLVLAQVPLSRFLRVDERSADWLHSIAGLSADLVLCDGSSRVLAVVDVRGQRLSEGSKRRHERMSRVLRAAGIKVLTWHEEALPDVGLARSQLLPLLAAPSAAREAAKAPTSSRPMPLIPVADIAEILAEGDADAADGAMEPVPSALFDDLEPVPTGR